MRSQLKPAFLVSASLACLAISAPSFAQDETQADEDVIVVTGRAQQLYRVVETSSTRLPTDPLSSPTTVSVINDQLIKDQGARDAQDLYRNLSGVSVFSYAGVTARGFRQEEIFFDGLRGDPYAGFSVPQLFNVERVEFLKGPAGMLYGPGAPGGLFNYITHKPSYDYEANTTLVVGSEARLGGSAELTGALPFEGAAGRIGLFYEDRNTPRVNTGSETVIYDGGLTFDLNFAQLTLQGTRYEQRLQGNRLRGVPVDDTGRFIADRRWNHNEPGDYLDLVSNNVQARLEGLLDQYDISWNVGLRYTDSQEDQEYHEPRTLIDTDADGVLDFVSVREFRDQTRAEESISFAANAIWSHDFDTFSNRVLIGYDYFDQEDVFDYLRARGTGQNVQGISLVDPQYGLSDRSTYTLSTVADGRTTEGTRQGGYILNEASFGPLIALAGVRFDRFEDPGFEDEKATWRAGLVYKVNDEVSLFGQWAESYEPQAAGNQIAERGGPFDPTEGEILEAGVRTELIGGRIQSSASIYQIVRTNILQNDPLGDRGGDGFDDFIAFGEVTSEGFELDVTADITENWVITASYAYNDTRITENNGTTRIRNSVGDKFANAPKHQAGFWTRYQLPERGLAFALGGDYVDVQQSLSGQKVRPYLIFDGSIIWDAGPVEFLLRVDNLTDETYASSGFLSRTGHFPGDPRSAFLEISREW